MLQSYSRTALHAYPFVISKPKLGEYHYMINCKDHESFSHKLTTAHPWNSEPPDNLTLLVWYFCIFLFFFYPRFFLLSPSSFRFPLSGHELIESDFNLKIEQIHQFLIVSPHWSHQGAEGSRAEHTHTHTH